MCGRFVQTSFANMSQLLDVEAATGFSVQYNIAPSMQVSVVVGEDGKRRWKSMRWGLLPAWVKDTKKFPLLFNAKIETLSSKPAFRQAYKARHCVVPADGFFEWRAQAGIKQPYYIHSADTQPLFFAGLWEQLQQGDEKITSCTIVTRDADSQIRPLHHRMPAMLSASAAMEWLSPTRAEGWLEQATAVAPALSYHPVSTRLNRAREQDSALLEEIVLEETPEQDSLL